MKKVMVVVGHDFKNKGCYNNKLNVHEYDFCMRVATRLFAEEMWDDVDLVLKSRNNSYADLPKEINSYYPDYIVELHLNNYNEDNRVQGSEHLYCNFSERGMLMAEIFQKHCVEVFKLRDRKIDGRVKGENGYNILANTKSPCIIAEPFYLTNKDIKKEDLQDLEDKYVLYLKKSIREITNRGI